MIDHVQSRVAPWRRYSSHVKVRGTASKNDVAFVHYINSQGWDQKVPLNTDKTCIATINANSYNFMEFCASLI